MPKKHIVPAKRKEALQHRQQMKMAESAHAYVRGNTLRFYEWLQSDSVKASLPSGPDIWICGDCHTGNLGPVADVDGKIDIQIRDLDQTVIGNPAHDLLRLGLSLAMAARSSDLPGVTTALMIEEMITGYLATLTSHSASVEPNEIEPIRRVMRQSKTRRGTGQVFKLDQYPRRWKHLAQERIEDVTPAIPLGKKFWPLTKQERRQLQELFDGDDLPKLVHILNGKEDDEVRLLDAAYWMKGCSSLGLLRYAVLVGLGKKKDHQYRLLDIKEATPAAAPCSDRSEMPKNNAERAGVTHEIPFVI